MLAGTFTHRLWLGAPSAKRCPRCLPARRPLTQRLGGDADRATMYRLGARGRAQPAATV